MYLGPAGTAKTRKMYQSIHRISQKKAAAVRLHQHTHHSPAFLDEPFSSGRSPAWVRLVLTYSPAASPSSYAAQDDYATSTRSAEVPIILTAERTDTEHNFADFP